MSVILNVVGVAKPAAAARHRTSATEDMAELTPIPPAAGEYADALPPRSMATYRVMVK